MVSRARDTQRTAVYRAEDRVPWGRWLSTIAEVQAFVDEVVASPHWSRREAPRVVVARDGRGRRHACSNESWFGGEVRLPKWSRSQLIVLHELAHLCVPKGEAAHGPVFAREYIDLVRTFLSPEAADRLEAEFARAGVDVAARRSSDATASDEASNEGSIRGPSRRAASPEVRRILQLVKELRALSEGTDSPHESAAAAAKAQKLLLEHNLTLLEVETLDVPVDPLTEHKQEFGDGKRRIEAWRRMLVHAVAQASLCEWMTNFYGDPGPRTYSFIGRESNVEVAEYSYICLERQVVALAEAERKRRRREGLPVRGYLQSYCEGIVHTIHQRQCVERQRFQQASAKSRALVETRLGEAGRHRAELYPEVRFTTSSYVLSNGSAYAAGQRDGQKVALTHGLKGDGTPQRLIDRTGGR
ncbi:MAG: DUF2786 domain-containing protein [Planctomycetes bacterium]|nr:DUF2786 domain-containing protein [Planctomycetota bacterium]